MKETNHKLSEKFVGATISRPHFKEKAKGKNGITLIALIITIIVMMILVGVTVTVAINGGLFDKTKEAKIKHEIALMQDIVETEYLNIQAEKIARKEKNTKVSAKEVLNSLDKELNDVKLADGINEKNYIGNSSGAPTGACYIINPAEMGIETKNGKQPVVADTIIKDAFVIVNNTSKIYYIKEAQIQENTGGGGSTGAIPKDDDPLTIGAIEDLVDLSIMVNSGTFEEECKKKHGENVDIVVTLETSLNFNESASYRNAEDTSYGDLNGIEDDGNTIITEMTTGAGFNPIGAIDIKSGEIIYCFKGTFDGKENTISNLYINRPEGAATFLIVDSDTTIKNLTLENENVLGVVAVGIAISYDESVTNSFEPEPSNENLIIENCHTIGGTVSTKSSEGEYGSGIGLIHAVLQGNLKMSNCSNSNTILARNLFGMAYGMIMGSVEIDNCINSGKMELPTDAKFDDGDAHNEMSGMFWIASLGTVEISNCTNSGDMINCLGEVAGIYKHGGGAGGFTISNCRNTGNIICSNVIDRVAGIVECANYDMYGTNNKIISCVNTGNIIADEFDSSPEIYPDLAGIVCSGNPIMVSKCINKGNIIGYKDGNYNSSCSYGIGFVGEDGPIVDCCNFGEIVGASAIGIGDADLIYNCYNSGKVEGKRSASGISRSYRKEIVNSYNLGTVFVTETSGNAYDFADLSEGITITNCYALTGSETQEEKEEILESLNNNRENTWSEWVIVEDKHKGYPIFSWGIDEVEDPYLEEPKIPEEPEIPEEPDEEFETEEVADATVDVIVNEKSTINGEMYSSTNPVIPTGFMPINTETAKWDAATGPEVNNGLVISDGTNEFVWVPVGNINEMVQCQTCSLYGILGKVSLQCPNCGTNTKIAGKLYNFNNSTYMEYLPTSNYEPETTYENNFRQMALSVSKYKGFYVGRYETSVDGDGKAQSRKSTSDNVVVSVNASTNGSWIGLYNLQRTYVTDSVQGELIWGSQYDAMVRWLGTTTIGSVYNTTRNPGAEPSDVIKNIYDLYGNSYEWTQESCGTSTKPTRGGCYNKSTGSIAYRCNVGGTYSGITATFEKNGSRMTLCITE